MSVNLTPDQLLDALAEYPPHMARFMRYVKRAPNGCWLWQGSIDMQGYGQFRLSPSRGRAHMVAYELFVGPIPDGLVIDHVASRGCVHRHCVNPAHLEPVTHRENILRGDGPSARNARKTHCKHGHEFAGRNLVIDSLGRRVCRTCENATQRRKADRRRAAA